MAKRRAAGEGTVYQDKASGRWFGQATVPGVGRKTVTARTQKEALAKLKKVRDAIAKGSPIPSERLTLAEHLETWLADVVAPSVRPSVAVRYESNVRLHLIPDLGRKVLTRLSVADVQGMVARKAATVSSRTGRLLAPRTVNQILATLHNALQVALEQGLVTRNVADVVRGAKVEKATVAALTANMSIRLLSAARGTRLEGLVCLALTTGLRLGELVGLTWSDVDEAGGMLRVRRQRTRVWGVGLTESVPKSRTSRRPVVLTRLGISALRVQRETNALMQSGALARWEDCGLVFPNSRGRPWEPRTVEKLLANLARGAGLGHVTPHMLRHSTATLLYALKVPPKTVQEILGHTSIALTSDTYTDSVPAHHHDAMEALDGLFSSQLHTTAHTTPTGPSPN